jgi:hypothetical protein
VTLHREHCGTLTVENFCPFSPLAFSLSFFRARALSLNLTSIVPWHHGTCCRPLPRTKYSVL